MSPVIVTHSPVSDYDDDYDDDDGGGLLLLLLGCLTDGLKFNTRCTLALLAHLSVTPVHL